jgi:GxxExxY protein
MNESAKGREGPRRKAENSELPYADEVYQIIGAAIEVHRVLGHGFLESVYHEALYIELESRSIPFRSQVPIEIRYKDRFLSKHFICDFLAYDQIIIEIKASTQLGPPDTAQILNYLRATGRAVGLLVNFGSRGKLEWSRFVLSDLNID